MNFEKIIDVNYVSFTSKNTNKLAFNKKNKGLQTENSDTKVQIPISNEETKFDEDVFWRTIASLEWTNASDSVLDIHHIKRKLAYDEILYINKHIPEFASHIYNATANIGWYANASESDIKNFTWHVVGLGKQFYLSAILDPTGFIQFVWDSNPKEYQKLYDMIQSLSLTNSSRT